MDVTQFKRALLLINPRSNQGAACRDRAITLLKERGFELVEPEIESKEDLATVVSAAKSNQIDLAIVGGGDGSLNRVLNDLVKAQLPLGVLPLGTANSFAKTLEIPFDLTAACDTIATGMLKQIDLGCVNGRYFLNTASLGLSVEIVRNVDASDKRRWGSLAYFIESIRQFWGARPFRVDLDDGETIQEIKTYQIVIGNGYYFGGGMVIAPDSSLTNKKLHLTSVEAKHWSRLLSISIDALRGGKHVYRDRVRAYYFDRLRLQTDAPVPINADGEAIAQTPAEFEVKPRSLSVIVPKS